MLNLLPQAEVAAAKPKRTLFPVLVVLFLFSYGLMTMLIVEQGKTIEVQRFLIGQLFSDTAKLRHVQPALPQQNKSPVHAQEAPSSQAAPLGRTVKPRRPAPLKPPKDTADSSDVRRSLITI